MYYIIVSKLNGLVFLVIHIEEIGIIGDRSVSTFLY